MGTGHIIRADTQRAPFRLMCLQANRCPDRVGVQRMETTSTNSASGLSRSELDAYLLLLPVGTADLPYASQRSTVPQKSTLPSGLASTSCMQPFACAPLIFVKKASPEVFVAFGCGAAPHSLVVQPPTVVLTGGHTISRSPCGCRICRQSLSCFARNIGAHETQSRKVSRFRRWVLRLQSGRLAFICLT